MADINQDPSMEEILASIKRVIAEDGRNALASARGRSAERSEPEPELDSAAEDNVLELSNPISDEDRLISDGSAAASRQSLAVLAAMRQQNETPASAAPTGEGPLEEVVRNMLRPMLKEWLDERLPEIVEEMVAREIARITGKSF